METITCLESHPRMYSGYISDKGIGNYNYISDVGKAKDVITPGKSFSWLTEVWTKLHSIFGGFLWFLFTLQFPQESQDLQQTRMFAKIVQ